MRRKQFELSRRLRSLPPYLFAEIDYQKNKLKQKGIPLIDLSIGDPDIPAPGKMINVLHQASKLKENQKYALDQGKPLFKHAIKKWFRKRFGVTLDADREILPLIGSKEGLVHFPLGFVNPGEYVIVPSPGYPGYRGAALFAGAKIHELALLEKNSFLPQLKTIPLTIRNKAKVIYLNYPNNPTTALANSNFLKELVRFCVKYGIIIAYDNAYSEIYFGSKPLSILSLRGAREVAIEFHSLSKSFCVTGLRIGWACGSAKLVMGLLKVKTNIDSGVFAAIQDAASYALEKENRYVSELRNIIKQRRNVFVSGLARKGFENIYSLSTFYVWVRIPRNTQSSIEFARSLLKKGIVATPGVGFGKYGEGFVRFALTVDKHKLKKALTLI